MASLNDIPFLSGYMTMDAANRGREAQDFQRAGQFMTLQGAMEDRGAKRAELERTARYRTRMAAATTDAERSQIAMEESGPTGVLTHLDRISRDRATNERAAQSLAFRATQFAETRRQRQQEINRMLNKDEKAEAQQLLSNEARAFELQLKADAARLQGAIGQDTIMGFQPSPIRTPPTMQAPGAAAPAPAEPGVTYAFDTPQGRISGSAPNGAAALSTVGLREVANGSPAASVAAPAAAPDPWTPAPVAQAAPQSFPQPDAANLDARDLEARRGQPPSNIPYTQMPARTPIAPVPGQGVPGVRAQQAMPMPQFVGSPREVRKLQNEWREDVAKAAAKEASLNGKISLTGGRESVFINRVVNSGNQAVADLENVVKLPMTASRGIFGGRSQGKSLFEAGKETLANTMTTQEVQTYNVVATGFQRALAAIEGMGLAPPTALMHQMDAVLFKEGDTGLTKLAKLAQTRQIVEKGMETIVANQRVDPEIKKLAQDIMAKAVKAVPFTPGQVIELQSLQNTDPNATLQDVMARAKQQQGGAWSDDKEKRYQELLRKQRGGT